MKSPLRYPGGKSRLAKKILEFIPESVTVASPFFGGGSVELALMVRGEPVIGNDAFFPLYNFWLNAFVNNDAIVSLCDQTLKANPDTYKKLFYSSRIHAQICNEPEIEDNYYSAFCYFFVNRCSFSGATLSGGFSQSASEKRFTQSSIDRLAAVSEHTKAISLYNFDFRLFLKSFAQDSFLYCDPPYYEIDGLYGNNGDMSFGYEDHLDLAEILKNHPNGWALSYNDCPQIRELYDGFKFVELKPSLSMSNGKKSCPEVLILSN